MRDDVTATVLRHSWLGAFLTCLIVVVLVVCLVVVIIIIILKTLKKHCSLDLRNKGGDRLF